MDLRRVLRRALIMSLLLLGILSLPVLGEEPRVSNVFDNTYVVDALRDISAQTGIPIIADSTVQGQVTLSLDNVQLEEALQRVLTPGGFAFKNMGGYYLVGAADAKSPSFAVLSRTEVVKLRYAKAESAARLLSEAYSGYLRADAETNTIVITAPDTLLGRIKADLDVIDRPIQQIMIEALVVEVAKDGRKELGLDWKWTHNLDRTDRVIKDLAIKESGVLQVLDLGTSLDFTTDGGMNNFLVSLQAVAAKGDARVEANPRVATLDGQAAEIFVGRDRYYYLTLRTDEDSNTTTSQLEAIKTGINLKILPQVAENGEITVRIEPEVSDVVTDDGNGSLPVISRRKVSTTVRVKTGESIVLGGLLERTEHKETSKVPLLGDLPILGALFSTTKNVQEEGEVLIIITPYLMDSPDSGRVPKLLTPSANK